MTKLDLKKLRKELFNGRHHCFEPVDAPAVSYLCVDGHGDPNSAPEYKFALESLYSTAYTIKFSCKEAGRDFVVSPLEGLWSAPDPDSFTARRKHEWDWTMMIMVPDYVDAHSVDVAKLKSTAKLGGLSESLRFETLHEGLCLQALHVGSYDDEGPLLAKLHDQIMPECGYQFNGRHHEVYLSDPRKTAPEKLRTVIRQPVRMRDR